MKYEEFQQLARLYVLGALDPDEKEQFLAGRALFGPKGEAFIDQCRKLSAALALSLRPRAPHPETKEKLMEQIRALMKEKEAQTPVEPTELSPGVAIPFSGEYALDRDRSGKRRKRC